MSARPSSPALDVNPMPQLKNAEKALRQSLKRQVRNTRVNENIAYLLKSSKRLAAAKDKKWQETVTAAIKAIDKAAQKGIMKKNTAARTKSRLAKQIKKMMA